ncbi:MAG: hypothetical protein RIS56_1471 [Verrucomicrobiota bacterium]|jgi:hypothetical protein
MSKPISQVWTFPSDSNPDITYETLRYTDGSQSCNCLGWTRRVAADGARSCKHTRSIDMGTADQQSTATHSYKPIKPQPLNNHAQIQSIETPKLGQRRFAV